MNLMKRSFKCRHMGDEANAFPHLQLEKIFSTARRDRLNRALEGAVKSSDTGKPLKYSQTPDIG